MKPFSITRADGRSNAQVILDMVRGVEPGQTYTYAELSAAISLGTSRIYNVQAVRGVVINAQSRLLKEQQRALHNVRLVGYRLALAKEHVGLSVLRKHKADAQLKRGVQLLKHVRWDEMDDNTRAAHEGTLMIMAGFYEAQQAIDRRLTEIEVVIAKRNNMKAAA